MLFIRELPEDAFCQILINFSMPWNWLRNLGGGVVIPIMVAAMTNKNTAECLDLLNQIAMFHASSSSA